MIRTARRSGNCGGLLQRVSSLPQRDSRAVLVAMELLLWAQILRLSPQMILLQRLLLLLSELHLKISFLLNVNGLQQGSKLLFDLSWYIDSYMEIRDLIIAMSCVFTFIKFETLSQTHSYMDIRDLIIAMSCVLVAVYSHKVRNFKSKHQQLMNLVNSVLSEAFVVNVFYRQGRR